MFKKKTKIVATLGPATSDKETLREMMRNGVNVFRINFSHADYAEVKERVQIIRDINKEEGWNVAILADLQGPKLRVGVIKEGEVLEVGDVLSFTNEDCEGDKTKAFMTYQRFPKDVKAGERILIDDGKLILEVLETNDKDLVKAVVIQGGAFKSKKGVNLPNTKISLPALTEKDVKDAHFAIELGVDWMALSFVRNPDDIKELQELIEKNSSYKIPIISKIEKPEAIENIDEIIETTDGIMVARGDLGVEIPMQEVPLAQKMLVEKCKKARKPVIIATQMMETMIDLMTPTRAEVNDVANSVLDGADAVMLSGETSVGKYPVEVIKTMTKILKEVENWHGINLPENEPDPSEKERYITNSVCYSAAKSAVRVGAKVIITFTNSGYTAFQISSHRPYANIVVFTKNKAILRMLNLLWGVYAFYYDKELSTDATIKEINKLVLDKGLADESELVINLNSMPVSEKGMVNTFRISEICANCD